MGHHRRRQRRPVILEKIARLFLRDDKRLAQPVDPDDEVGCLPVSRGRDDLAFQAGRGE